MGPSWPVVCTWCCGRCWGARLPRRIPGAPAASRRPTRLVRARLRRRPRCTARARRTHRDPGCSDQGTFDDPVRRGDDAQSGAPVNLAPEQVRGGALELGPAMSNNSMLVDVVVAAGQGVSELRRPGLSPAGADHAASSLGRARSPPARCPCTSALPGVYRVADSSTYVRQRLEATCQRQGGVFGQGRSTFRLWPVLVRRRGLCWGRPGWVAGCRASRSPAVVLAAGRSVLLGGPGPRGRPQSL